MRPSPALGPVAQVGGVEALLSRLVARTLRLPCAHAPALAPLPLDAAVSPRAAAEELGHTFLPCVLANLHRAPALCSPDARAPLDATCGTSADEFVLTRADGGARGADALTLWARDVDAVIVPASACGGSALLSLAARPHVLIVAVEENACVMAATPEALGLGGGQAVRGGGARGVGGARGAHVVRAATYLEAVGIVAAHRAGLNLEALTVRGVGALPKLTSRRHV